jgi:hypothetical protein
MRRNPLTGKMELDNAPAPAASSTMTLDTG